MSRRLAERSGDIDAAYLRPVWQGLRTAEALTEACLDGARAQQVTIVELATGNTNTTAIHCHTRRCGHQAYEAKYRALGTDGASCDELMMARTI